jgi:NADP-dependent 3-hydroxy acid dehydrogenase YdfG
MTGRVAGTVTLVSGPSRDIGEATARFRPVPDLGRIGSTVAGSTVAGSTATGCTVARCGRLDTLVANAGGHVARTDCRRVAEAMTYIGTRPRHAAVNEMVLRPTEQER